jgi:DNA (cytosine-5)-methyltransferase 1
MVRYASVCDGIGAIHLASQPLGWQCAWTSEIAKFPAAVVHHHYAFRNLHDMTRFREWPDKLLADVDVLVGGSPCQPFSVAGRRRGLADDRNLTVDFVDLYSRINEVRRNHGRPPAILLWENVPGVLHSKDNAYGCYLAGLLGLDEALETQKGKWPKAGFFLSETVRVGYRVLDAQHFALAQRRRRVFLLAVPCELVERFGEGACPSQILSLPESLCRNTQAGRAGGKRTARGVGGRPAGDGGQGQSDYGCIAFHHNAQGCQLPSPNRDTGISDCLTASQRAAVAFTKPNRSRSIDDFETLAPGEVTQTLNCADHGQSRGTTVVVNDVGGGGEKRKTKVWKDDGTSYTLTTAMNQGVLVPPTIRRLTPVECERLMGYPDGYTAITYRDKPAADSPRYRSLGNSMAVPIVRWICERIQKAVNAPGKD